MAQRRTVEPLMNELSILYKGDGLLNICLYYSWEILLYVGLEASFFKMYTWKGKRERAGERIVWKLISQVLKFPVEFSMGVNITTLHTSPTVAVFILINAGLSLCFFMEMKCLLLTIRQPVELAKRHREASVQLSGGINAGPSVDSFPWVLLRH
jgi:hypothetical protein